jgi:hypothetical protein
MPAQYHINYVSKEKSQTMRFLTILRMADAGTEPRPSVVKPVGILTADGIQVRAKLDANEPEGLSVETDSVGLFINHWPEQVMGQTLPTPNRSATVLVERVAGSTTVTVTENLPPVR